MISRIIVIAAILTGTSVGAKLEVDLAVESVVRNRLESGQVEAKKRQATIRDLFGEAGCSPGEQRVDKNSANVICTLPGQSTSSIVVGGHFDFAEHGTGMVDDWSGTALLPSLYQALKSRPHQHTYVFVAFAAEERGLVGSSR